MSKYYMYRGYQVSKAEFLKLKAGKLVLVNGFFWDVDKLGQPAIPENTETHE